MKKKEGKKMGITKEQINQWEQAYQNNPMNHVIKAAITKVGLAESATNPESIRRHNFQFSDKTLRGNKGHRERRNRLCQPI